MSFVRSALLVSSTLSLSFLLVFYLFLVFLSSVGSWSFSFSSFVPLRLSGFLLGRLGIFVLLVVSHLSWLHLRSSDLLRSPSVLLALFTCRVPLVRSIGVMRPVIGSLFLSLLTLAVFSASPAHRIPTILAFLSISIFPLSSVILCLFSSLLTCVVSVDDVHRFSISFHGHFSNTHFEYTCTRSRRLFAVAAII